MEERNSILTELF